MNQSIIQFVKLIYNLFVGKYSEVKVLVEVGCENADLAMETQINCEKEI